MGLTAEGKGCTLEIWPNQRLVEELAPEAKVTGVRPPSPTSRNGQTTPPKRFGGVVHERQVHPRDDRRPSWWAPPNRDLLQFREAFAEFSRELGDLSDELSQVLDRLTEEEAIRPEEDAPSDHDAETELEGDRKVVGLRSSACEDDEEE